MPFGDTTAGKLLILPVLKIGSKCPKYEIRALLRGNCNWYPFKDIGKPKFSVQQKLVQH
jgi:hypothetical protein